MAARLNFRPYLSSIAEKYSIFFCFLPGNADSAGMQFAGWVCDFVFLGSVQLLLTFFSLLFLVTNDMVIGGMAIFLLIATGFYVLELRLKNHPVKKRLPSIREEVRIVMSIDPACSVDLYAPSGEAGFQRMLWEFHKDVHSVIRKSRGALWHYSAKEVVVSWSVSEGLENKNCLTAYFELLALLELKKGVYLFRYGTFPEIKAGLYFGRVMLKRKGIFRRKIYHLGETALIAARIGRICRAQGSNLIASSVLLNLLLLNTHFRSRYLGKLLLKERGYGIILGTISRF